MHEGQLSLRNVISESIAYWEPRRIIYNSVLVVLAVAFGIVNLRHLEADIDLELFTALAAFLILANLLFSTGYLLDLIAASLNWGLQWRRFRGIGFHAGLLIAGLAASRFFVVISDDFF